MAEPHIMVWSEYQQERTDPEVTAIYPDGIHSAVAEALRSAGLPVQTATLDEPEHGLTDAVLAQTDVLYWWGHVAHDRVDDAVVLKVHERVLSGMGLVVLHSGHYSKIFQRLMGATCNLKWRHDDFERLWIVAPGHPIAQGLGEYIELDEEMYGEPFDVPPPETLVFLSWFRGGEVFRSGCCYTRGLGRIFYFRPGHEANPTYHHPDVQRVLVNAARWAAPTPGAPRAFGHADPVENSLL